jgi:hypothetical protein
VVRTVRVRLELDRNDYKQGLRDAAGDTRTFDGEVRGLGKDAERTGVELKQTATEARKLGDDVKRSSREVDGLGNSLGKTSEQTRKTRDETTGLGKETDRTRTKVVTLAEEIDKTRNGLRDLGAEFERTGQVDVGKFRQLTDELERLRRVQQDLDVKGRKGGGLLGSLFGSSISNSLIKEVEQTGLQAGELFSQGFLSAAFNVLKAGGPVLIPAAAALVAAVGAMFTGAALAGTGVGAIAVGLALQFSDPRVRGAASDLATYLKSQLTEATSSFAPRAAAGFAALQREAGPFLASLREGLTSLAPYVANLLARLGEGLGKLGPGLGHALQAAGPVLEQLGRDLPMLMAAFGSFFDQIAQGAQGGTEALHALLFIIASLISGSGLLLHAFSAAFDAMAQAGDKVTGVLAGLFGALAKIPGISPVIQGVAAAFAGLHDYTHNVATSFDEAGLAADSASGAFNGMAGAAGSATGAIGMTRQALLDFQGNALSADQAAGQWRQGLLGLADAVKQNGTSLEQGTAKGEANIAMLQDMVGKARASRDAQIAHGESVAYADSQYQAQIGDLINVATKLGFTRSQVENLIGQYRQVPGNVNTNIITPGLDEALRKAGGLREALRGIDGSVARASVITYYKSEVQGVRPASPGVIGFERWGGAYEHAASGLLREANTYSAASPARYAFAEQATGGEAFVPKRGNYGRSMSILGKAASWYGAQVVPATQASTGAGVSVQIGGTITLQYPDGRKIAELLIDDSTNRGGTAFPAFVRSVASR